MKDSKKCKNTVLISCMCLIVFCFCLPLAAVAAPVPFEDVNNNGIFDAGDKNITNQILAGYFETENSIVIPAGARSFLRSGEIALVAGRDITVNNYYLNSSSSSIIVQAQGNVTIGDRTILKAFGFIYVGAGEDVVISRGATVYSRADTIQIESQNGQILVEENATLYAKGGLYVDATGEVTTLSGSQLKSANYISVGGGGDVKINGDRIEGLGVHVTSGADLVEFCNNTVKLLGSSGWVYLAAADSTVNITGTNFINLKPENLFIDAEVTLPN